MRIYLLNYFTLSQDQFLKQIKTGITQSFLGKSACENSAAGVK